MNVAEHRAPYRRIEIGSSRGADRRRDITEALSGVGPTERDRIWNLVVQAARDGIGAVQPKPEEVVCEGHLPALGGFADEPLFLRDRGGV
jgi:hypothetical protein